VAGIPFKSELPKGVDTTKKRKLFDTKLLGSERKFVAMVSGLNIGGYGDAEDCQEAMFMLSSFLKGQHTSAKMNKLASQVQRLVICGDSVRENSDSDKVYRGSYRTQEINKIVYKDIDEIYTRFEDWM